MRERKSRIITAGRLASHLPVDAVPRKSMMLNVVVFAAVCGLMIRYR